MMIGNSMKSDVVPMVEAGGYGVYVPHGLSWELEHAAAPEGSTRYHEITDLSHLPGLIEQVTQG
jgi:putative hydrolase of the HAD superfamily